MMTKLSQTERLGVEEEDFVAQSRLEFGARLMRLREERGWSRGELAERLGVSRERLGNWERGENSPPFERLADLGRVLRASLDELIAGLPPRKWPGAEERAEASAHLAALRSLLEKWL